MIWGLRMGLNQKLAVTILIGFGIATTGCSIGRVLHYATNKFAEDQTCNTPLPQCQWLLSTDMNPGSGINLVIWTTLETNVGIFAANLPALGVLRKKIQERIASLSAPVLRHLLLCSLRGFSESEGREGLPSFGKKNLRPTAGAINSILDSYTENVSLGEHLSDVDCLG
jgi:hypothetical protein